MPTRILRPLLVAIALLAAPSAATAHHGLMIWAEEVTAIEGFVSSEMDGFPHWEISIRTPEGRDWAIDVGSDFEMGRAGMRPDDLPIGTEVRVEGNLPKGDPGSTLLRPLRIIAGDKTFEFRANWN